MSPVPPLPRCTRLGTAGAQALLDRIEAVPASPETVHLKAAAVLLIHNDDPSSFADDRHCTDARLVRQMLEAFVGRV